MFDETPDEQLPKPRPVVSWAGGKHKLLQHILPLVPKHTAYIEVFGGGLALFCAKERSHLEIINDVHGDLVMFYRCCKYHLEALQDELDLVQNARRDFEDYCRQPGLTDIQKAARWFLRNKLSFGGQGTSFAISRQQPLSSRAQRLLAIRSLNRRLDHTTIEEKPWEYIVKTYDHPEALFFFDPPYLAGVKVYAGWSEHELARFCERIKTLRGKFLFTFEDCAQVRDAMAGYTIKAINRPRGISNKVSGKKAARYHEVIITSDRLEAARSRKGVAS